MFRNILIQHVDNHLLFDINDCKTARAVWTKLEGIFCDASQASKMHSPEYDNKLLLRCFS